MAHIALVTTSFPTNYDGSEAAGSFVADFAEALADKAQVTVVAPSSYTGREKHHKFFTVERFCVPRLPLSLLKPYNPLYWPAIVKTLNAGLKTLDHVAQHHSIDHIFALWILPSGYWSKRVGDSYKIPYSTWALGSDIWNLAKIPGINTILKRVLKDSWMNFADGYLLKQSVEHIAGRPCHFLPSTRAINIPRQKSLSSQPPYNLAFLGRWHPNKGTDLLVESLGALVDADWQLIKEIRICGGGPLEDSIKASTTDLSAQGRPIVLHGYLNKRQATDLFLWADYVLLPSRIESIPIVFSDAMKCHCPVACMPVGDLPRLVPHYRVGVISQEVSVPAFTRAIRKILRKSPRSFAQGLEQAADAFQLENIVETLLKKLFSDLKENV